MHVEGFAVRRVSPAAFFMLGKIKLEHGSKVGVLGVAPHANNLVDALTSLQFPDELSAEELAQYRSQMEVFRARLGV